jgi:hypothetical protein
VFDVEENTIGFAQRALDDSEIHIVILDHQDVALFRRLVSPFGIGTQRQKHS